LASGLEDPAIKLQLLLEGEKSVKEALRRPLELQTILLAARPQKNERQDILEKTITPNWVKRPNAQ
jgi:hypothetical protein